MSEAFMEKVMNVGSEGAFHPSLSKSPGMEDL